MGLHNCQWRGACRLLKALQIVGYLGGQPGIQPSGYATFVLTPGGQNGVGGTDRQAGDFQGLADPLLMGRIQIGKQQTQGHRLRLVGKHLLHQL